MSIGSEIAIVPDCAIKRSGGLARMSIAVLLTRRAVGVTRSAGSAG